MVYKSSLPGSQEPISGPHSELGESSPCTPILFFNIHFIIHPSPYKSSHDLFPSGFLLKLCIHFHSLPCMLQTSLNSSALIYPKNIKKKLHHFSPQANYTDQVTTTCRRNLVPTFCRKRVSRGQRNESPQLLISVF
jgi:hypothetical protein